MDEIQALLQSRPWIVSQIGLTFARVIAINCESPSCSHHMQGAPKLKVAIVGGGLAGLSTAVELLDQG